MLGFHTEQSRPVPQAGCKDPSPGLSHINASENEHESKGAECVLPLTEKTQEA